MLPDNIILYGIEIDTTVTGATLSQRVENDIELLVVQLQKRNYWY
ncbi:conserved protein of unknown function [Legionella fallonii LLAP-10]|uniref:Uncharacterized protein n=1 Tax=Legionella fallonii LLAP-10 TaxID=1212491 RepID=A0A098G5L4_9GAMM|nr:conserved protein of unknown function [Legionella fallonii LLAP-10]